MKSALITGATEGIGLEFARIFAQNKINLILIARNETRLQEIQKELMNNGIEVKIYATDLSILENAKYIYEDIKRTNVIVDFVVNNAGNGIGNDYTETSWETELQLFNLNILTVAYFTKVFAQDMKIRKFGRILNVGSTAAFLSIPFMAGYSASKAFVLSLSEIVNFQLKGSGVTVTTLCPGVTKTNFHNNAHSGSLISNKILPVGLPSEVAQFGYKLMMNGTPSGIPGFINKTLVFFSRFLTRNFLINLSSFILKSLKKGS